MKQGDDGLRSFFIGCLEYEAQCLRHHADGIARNAPRLTNLPPYETKAGDELKQAERALMEALSQVREARKHFERPVDLKGVA